MDGEFIPFYKKLGRDRFIEVLQEHPCASRAFLLKTYKKETEDEQ